MSYFKRFLIFALSALLILAPPAAYATTSTGGWTALDTITAGATNTINATKTAGGKVLNSAVTVGASAAKVGKHLIKGGGQAALAYAVVELLGEGVDWVLDPANNAVKYKPIGNGTGYYWEEDGLIFGTHSAACNYLYKKSKPDGDYVAVDWPIDKYSNYCRFQKPDGSYSTVSGLSSSRRGTAEPVDDWKYLPINTVAAQVISNAEAGHAPSQEAVKATALEGFAAGEHDAALDAAAVPDTGVENPPDTENPPKDPDAPAEPFDPAGIISAINALKAMLAGILSSITGLSDFFKAEPDPVTESTEVVVDAPIDDFDTDKSYITFSGSCPPNYTASMSIMGNTVPFSFDYAPICTVMSALKPFIVGAGYLTAAYIIAGHSRGSRD